MRFFDLLNFQHVMAYIFCGLIFLIVFGVALGYAHFRHERSEQQKSEIVGHFPEGIEDRVAPFPLVMVLIISGVVIWGFLYILMHGLMGVKI
ncbi:MAG: hypothetical protein VR64_10175 [Desulfatitalea sp. BRH_c12]|nr:MAG: hypothetical protein VR64_10175 [Desulfatitalea sp. BRH_c12]